MNVKSLLGGALILGGLAAVAYAFTSDEDEAVTSTTDETSPNENEAVEQSVEATSNQDTPSE